MTLDELWKIALKDRAPFYDCSIEDFGTIGTTFKYRKTQDEDSELYFTQFDVRAFITAGQKTLDKVMPLINDRTLMDFDILKTLFPDLAIEESYPHYLFGDTTIEIPPLTEGYSLKKVDPADHKTLQVFLDSCSEEDIDDALIDLEDPDEEIRLVYFNEVPIGYAGYRPWGDDLGDVGILIQPEHRMKGLGLAAVAAATEACISRGRTPFYRSTEDNKGSQKIAENLGYTYLWRTYEINCFKKP